MKAVSFHRSLKSVLSEKLGVELIERVHAGHMALELLASYWRVSRVDTFIFIGIYTIFRQIPLPLFVLILSGHNLCPSYCSVAVKRYHGECNL